ncbi:MAG: hypothetical protein HZA22_06590 [Nitrospirae bacterium]|nr:hypothetical protein [Nitrospirota bacterium]MBI5694122.1 hypothetical protein [Nitrospirota bacterium]
MKLLTASAAAILLTLSSALYSLAGEGYTVPDVSRAQLVLSESQYVSDKEPPTRIDIRTYKDKDGNLVRSYSVGDAVFRYDVDTDGRTPYEFRILDNDGDGAFETKESLVGEMAVQEKGQKYFIDLGPEQGREYRYSYEDAKRPDAVEQRQLLMGYPIYIPQWVILRTP